MDIPGLEDPSKEDSVFRTVVHGDAHVNNMMFSSNDPNTDDLRLTYKLAYISVFCMLNSMQKILTG